MSVTHCPIHNCLKFGVTVHCRTQSICCLVLVIPCPMHTLPSAVYCYAVVPFFGTRSVCCRTCNAMPHVGFTLAITCLLWCVCSMSAALCPFAVLLVIPYPMSTSLCPSTVYWVTGLQLFHVSGTQSIWCLTGNAVSHVHFELANSCLLLCCCLMSVAFSPFPALLVMPSPYMPISLWPSAVYCYVVSCLWHSVPLLPYFWCHAPCPFHCVHQLSTFMLLSHVCGTQSICCLACNTIPHVCCTLSISCLLLYCCPMSVALSPYAVLHVIPYPMSVSLCPSAVCCYVAVPCLWHSVHLLSCM